MLGFHAQILPHHGSVLFQVHGIRGKVVGQRIVMLRLICCFSVLMIKG